jgi:hypothetical protein
MRQDEPTALNEVLFRQHPAENCSAELSKYLFVVAARTRRQAWRGLDFGILLARKRARVLINDADRCPAARASNGGGGTLGDPEIRSASRGID